MSEDWFEYVMLPSGCVLIIGSDKDGNQIEITIKGDDAVKIAALESQQQTAMRNLLRSIVA